MTVAGSGERGTSDARVLGYATAREAHESHSTEYLVSLMRLFEAFSLYTFRRKVPYFVDSGTLLGCLRHRGIIPWDNDVDVAMLADDFRSFLDTYPQEAPLILERDAYGDPDGCVWFRDALSGKAGLDLSGYERSGRSLMSLPVQREWPLDAWKSERAGPDSWRYDFERGDLDTFVTIDSFCGPQRAPHTYRKRLERHYDGFGMDLAARDLAARELPFDPALCPVDVVREYGTIDEGLAKTEGREPFVVNRCDAFDIDAGRIEHAMRREPKPLVGHQQESGLRFDPVYLTGSEAISRYKTGSLDINIFDCPSTVLPLESIPRALARATPAHEDFPFRVGYLLSPERYETVFHKDGVGHTYNYLLEGEKFWWFVEPHHAPEEWLAARSITEILTADRFARWGRVHVLHQRAGSAVVFPGTWPHRVFTYAPSMGLAGYIHLEVGRV